MATWTKKKLGEVCDVIPGYAFKSADFADSGKKIVKIKNIQSDFTLELNSCDRVREEVFVKRDLSKYRIRPKEILIAMTGATIGKVGRLSSSEEVYLNQRVALFRSKFINNDYLWSLLRFPKYQTILKRIGGGAAQANMSNSQIESIDIDIPDHKTQSKIADVLSVYDDLIENNEKRIKILEEMAQRLYNEWFVKFKFPGHEKIKMIDSGTEYGKIPEGWEVVIIGSLLGKVKRKVKIQASEYLNFGDYPIVDQGREFIAGYTNDKETIYNQDLIVFGDHSRCFKYCNFAFACGADGTQLLATSDSDRMPEILLYHIVLNSGLQSYNYARHFKFLKDLRVVKPDFLVAKKFGQIVDTAYSQIRALRDQNMVLARTRDLLIPQLVTGKRELG